MISREEATRITSDNYPHGPERLAERLKVAVVKSPLTGVEGWCVQGKNTVIRVNSKSSPFRQRFTLAHELAHLVLGTEPDIAREPFRSSSAEEREADRLASEFLIPQAELERHIRGQIPIDARTLERLAKAANVSPVMAACRVVSSTTELGLQNSALVFFQGGVEQWRYSHGLRFDQDEAERLLMQAIKAKPNPVRESNNDGNTVVGSLIDAMQAYQVLLVQLLPEETASQETREERLRTLAKKLFGDDYGFQQSVAASLGTVKAKCKGQGIDVAVSFFSSNYSGVKYTGAKGRKLQSEEGQEYIRLYLERWFS